MILAAALATHPHLGGAVAPAVPVARVLLALLACMVVALLAVALIRQRGGKADLIALLRGFAPRPARIEVIEVRRLSPHADIALFRAKGREWLVLVQAGSAQLLDQSEGEG